VRYLSCRASFNSIVLSGNDKAAARQDYAGLASPRILCNCGNTNYKRKPEQSTNVGYATNANKSAADCRKAFIKPNANIEIISDFAWCLVLRGHCYESGIAARRFSSSALTKAS
jgi:hypothetical protein